jgi:serine/threonine protein kinase
MSLQPGTTLGPYQIEAPLGAGGMGEVYQATDTRLDRDVSSSTHSLLEVRTCWIDVGSMRC